MEKNKEPLDIRLSKLINAILMTEIFLVEELQPEIVDFSSKRIEELFDFLLNWEWYIRYHEIIFRVDTFSGTDIISVYFWNDIENHIWNYNFSIYTEKDEIRFMNHHRWVNWARRKWIWTRHLKRLEKLFIDLWKSLSKKVFFEFVFVEKQEDTQSWLRKNWYKQEREWYFVKQLI